MYESFKHYRRDLGVPAIHALRWARAAALATARAAATGFSWRDDHQGRRHAAWREQGFDLVARIDPDPDGWWTQGIESIGKFIARWEPGAIRHFRGSRRECDWFLPANPGRGHDDYRLARAYGDSWWYVRVAVHASRCGVPLGEASREGIEYRPGRDDDLNETAFELADEAMHIASEALKALCGCESPRLD